VLHTKAVGDNVGLRSARRVAGLVLALFAALANFGIGAQGASAAVHGTSTASVGPSGSSWSSIACSGVGQCTAVGNVASGPAAITSSTGGVWHAPIVVGGTSGGTLTAVSCADASDCTAVGAKGAGPSAPNSVVPFAMTERNGRWGSPVVVPGSSTSGFGGGFTDVSCWTASNCAAVLTDAEGSKVALERNGVWGRALQLGPPGAALVHVSCVGGGWCLAVGTSASGLGLADMRNNGRWTSFGLGSAALTAVGCSAAFNCVVVASPHGNEQYLVEASGLWSTPIAIPSSSHVVFRSISCPPGAPQCIAVGAVSGSARATSVEVGLALQGAVAPSSLGSGSLTSVSCPVRGRCTAIGSDGAKGIARQFSL